MSGASRASISVASSFSCAALSSHSRILVSELTNIGTDAFHIPKLIALLSLSLRFGMEASADVRNGRTADILPKHRSA